MPIPSPLKTPGVYVGETNAFPMSIATSATAVPVFIGTTEQQPSTGSAPVLIASLLEYEKIFGRGFLSTCFVDASGEDSSSWVVKPSSTTTGAIDFGAPPPFSLYYALKWYFMEGGGPCYVVSIRGQWGKATLADFVDLNSSTSVLSQLNRLTGPTLVVPTDAISTAKYVTKSKQWDYQDVKAIYAQILSHCQEQRDRFAILDVPDEDAASVRAFADSLSLSTGSESYGAAYYPLIYTSIPYDFQDATVTVQWNSGGSPTITPLNDPVQGATTKGSEVKRWLQNLRVVLPPSGGMAGVYARVDRQQGVWKAPANVAFTGAIEPMRKILDTDQADLNAPDSGRAVNVVRQFTGRGTLVWGGRTLAGLSNDWRYINVRRLMIMIQDSIQSSLESMVFEPNVASTWTMATASIDAFLNGLWQQGALAGTKASDAYKVSVGLGLTMTAQDVLDGKMIVQIMVAPARPAEFILLQFTQMLQTS
ncbi:MAG: hypothetical protein RLZZ165_1322 [Bacteroidota bacterium]|jgi:phage tail sheath protein FI